MSVQTGGPASLCLLALALGVFLGCDSSEPSTSSPRGVSSDSAPAAGPAEAPGQPSQPTPAESAPVLDGAPSYSAQAVMDEVLAEPSLPGAPDFEARRKILLMRAKGEPVFFISTPTAREDVSEAVVHYRQRLRSTAYPWDVLEQLLPRFLVRPALGRQVLLRQGYLYATDPELSFALVSQVGPQHLFDEQQIWIQRGDRLMHASKKGPSYVYDDGPLEGESVKLLMFDRLGTGHGPHTPALHRDFRSLRYQLGFDRVRVRHVTEHRILADLRYEGSLWVPTLLSSEGARLELDAEYPEQDSSELERQRERALARVKGVQAMRQAILLQVRERLPFDEPRNEVGQEDGKLRRSFRFVYGQGKTSFKIRNDRYPVFDRHGNPLTPQVCIDFLLDTFERASGTWWGRQDEARVKKQGRLNFDEYRPRDILRRAHEFIDFTQQRSELFDFFEVPAAERVAQGDKQRFFEFLAKHTDLFLPGDIAMIRGLTPWDDRQEHYHSFFIYETDPLSGVPIAISGNAGTPAIWSWESEARRTPERTLRNRIRPTLQLLERVAGQDPSSAPTPPPLVSVLSPTA